MKKMIIRLNLWLIILATVSSCGYVKKQQKDFNGILEFQINKTTIEDLDTRKYQIKEITIQDGITDQIDKMGINSVTDWELLCDGVKKFKIEDFKEGTIEFSSVTLTFYKDTLMEFSSSVNYETDDILRAKYPNYEYTSDDGNSSDEWYNQSITARFHDDKKYGSFFSIYNTYKSIAFMT